VTIDILPENRTAAGIRLGRNVKVKNCSTLNTYKKQTAILMFVANEEVRNNILELCKKNNYYPLIATDPEQLIKKIKGMSSAIVFVDHEAVKKYGARIYSRINVACSNSDVLLLCDQAHRDLVKEAMELSVYACILAPFEEWEVLTMIRNILAKKKPR
jgi:DNA-binding NtrC family response regulator